MSIQEIAQLVEHIGIGGLAIALWWLERKERIELERRLEELLQSSIPKTNLPDNLREDQ